MAQSLLARPAVAAGLMIVFLLIGLGIGYGIWGVLLAPPPPRVWTPPHTYKIVFLAPLTGVLSTYGENSKFTAELATEDLNHWLERHGADFKIELIVEDTATDPKTALDKMKYWAGAGVKVFVGPMSSGECKECKEYADANKLIYVAPSSTSPALAIPDDYLFRFCPTDLVQGPAMAKVLWEAGVRHLIQIWRGDTWGDGLAEAIKNAFIELGGTVHDEYAIRYDPGKTDFPTEAKSLADAVKALLDAGIPADEIGINAISFEEIAPLMEDASAYEELKKVRWFGSDGTCLQPALVEHPVAGKFAAEVKFINTLFTVGASEYPFFDYVRRKGLEVLGRELDAYAYATYDIVWCLGLSIYKVGYDPEKIKDVLPEVTDWWTSINAASGHVVLDENGDRAYADYDLWAVVLKDGTPTWEKVGVWRGPPPGEIEWFTTFY